MRSTASSTLLLGLAAAVAIAAGGSRPLAQSASTGPAAEVDRLFARFTRETPGCAVGVSVDGATVLARGYGMADLEHDVPNAADTIFEAGSVSKQFTAAAVLLLVRDGKLSLDDPVRKHIPELPDYGTTLTIRHMLNHTSGLRDWGSLAGIAGWPRTTRVHTHAHVLEIVGRQTATNFTPGTHWSYSNTGYNLAAILVARVSGMSFAEFTRTRLFAPLGMTKTSWRDDHTRIVKGRAIGYDERNGGFATDMPFEAVHGNGGLLTTVGDLLTWTANLQRPAAVTDAAFVEAMQTPVTFSGGRGRGYGLGLMLDERRGVRQIDHSGSTAGYLAHLARYPDQNVAVAVLCNVSSAQSTQRAYDVADLYLAMKTTLRPAVAATTPLGAGDLARLPGLFRSRLDGRPVRVVADGSGLRIAGGPALLPQQLRFLTAGGQSWEFRTSDHLRASDRYDAVDYERVLPATPSAAELAAVAGRYVNDEIEATLDVSVDGGALIVARRPDARLVATPVYRDAFTANGLGLLIVRRDAAGAVVGLTVQQDRVWDLRFARQSGPGGTRDRR